MERYRFDRPAATIGRAFDNDIIVHDPYVDAHHLRITNDLHGLAVENLSEEGYTTIAHKESHEPRTPLASGTAIEIGKTHLRVFSTTHKVAPVLKFERVDRIFTVLTRPGMVAFLTLGYVLVDYGNNYLSRFSETTLAANALGIITSLMPAVAWAAFWALISRISRGEPRFFHHWVAVVIALIMVIVFDRIGQVFAFNFGNLVLNEFINYVSMAVTLVFVLVINMRFAFRQRTWVRHTFAYGTTTALIAYLLLNAYGFTREFRPFPEFDSTLLPAAFLWRGNITEAQFMDRVDGLFEFPESETTTNTVSQADAESQASGAVGELPAQ
jgi:hypothetical protein